MYASIDESMNKRMDGWMRLFDAYLPLIALYLQNSKLIKNDYTDQETVQIRTTATTATNIGMRKRC